HLALSVFYPAAIRERPAAPFVMPFFTKLNLYKDAEPAFGTSKHPPRHVLPRARQQRPLLRVVRRVSGWAWLHRGRAQPLPRQHLRLDDCLPREQALATPARYRPQHQLAAERPVLGQVHRRGSVRRRRPFARRLHRLWVGGARINPDKYLALQRGWRNNQMVPEYLRNELPLDAAPALDVHDQRVKAVFAMAPGVVQAFGMDEAGLRQLA